MNIFKCLAVISENQYKILQCLLTDSDLAFDFNYISGDTNLDRKTIKKEMKELRAQELVTYTRGLMTEDGEVAGSGYHVNWENMSKVNREIRKYENNI